MPKTSKEAPKAQGANVEQDDSQDVQLVGIEISRMEFAEQYAIVNGATDRKFTVSSVSKELPVLDGEKNQVYSNGEDGRPLMKHIINLKAIPAQHLADVKEAWKGKETLDLGYLRGKTLSINAIVPENGEITLPYKGQKITVVTGYILDKEDPTKYETNEAGVRKIVGKTFHVPAVADADKFVFDDEEIEMED